MLGCGRSATMGDHMAMRQFMIERNIPQIGKADQPALQGAAKTSNSALAAVGESKIKWLHSYVTADKTFCVYEAEDESYIHQHAEKSGFPATKITEIHRMIGPATADGK